MFILPDPAVGSKQVTLIESRDTVIEIGWPSANWRREWKILSDVEEKRLSRLAEGFTS